MHLQIAWYFQYAHYVHTSIHSMQKKLKIDASKVPGILDPVAEKSNHGKERQNFTHANGQTFWLPWFNRSCI